MSSLSYVPMLFWRAHKPLSAAIEGKSRSRLASPLPTRDDSAMPAPAINILHITTNEHTAIFDDLLELLTDTLEQLGHAVQRTTTHFDRSRINILVGHTAALEKEAYDSIRSSGAKYIIFQMETLTDRPGIPRPSQAYLDVLSHANQVWDYSKNNLAFLAARGCRDLQFIPLGYSRRLERIAHAEQKDMDVLFYGAGNARRLKIVDALRARGLRVDAFFKAYGSARDQAIARARIVLNLHKFDHSELEQVRISYLLNNRVFVISESAEGNPWGDGVVFSDYDKIVDCCVESAQPGKDAARVEIATKGYEALKSLPIGASLEAALARIQ